jgi:hypothetical protein
LKVSGKFYLQNFTVVHEKKVILNKTENKNQHSSFFQPKLTINQPNDVYEQEADAVADKVMRMPDHTTGNNLFFKPAISSIQRKCAHCEEEEKQMQRKEDGNGSGVAAQKTEGYVNSLSGGNALDKNEKHFFESRMGYDFGDVKIHSDDAAAKSAQSINALAYTTGNNIVFAHGQYVPGTDSGKRLLAHELTHVIQQQAVHGNNTIQREEGCTAMTRVTVDTLSFRGSNRNPYDDIAAANTIYRPCCVEFVPGVGQSVDPAVSDPLMGNDTNFDRGDCGADTAEEQALIPAVTSTFGLSGRIRALYFESITPGARATSHPAYCSTPLALNYVYMTNTADSRTLAHEMGHIFLNGYFHELPPDNLMHPTNTATGSNLTPDQCATIRGNI